MRLDIIDGEGEQGDKSYMLVSNLWAWAVGSTMCQDEGWGNITCLWGDDVCGQLNLWHIPMEMCLQFGTVIWARDRFAAISMQ